MLPKSGPGYEPPVDGNAGMSAMQSPTGRSKAGNGPFGHEAWCGLLWLLTLSITTCRVWPRSHGVPDSPVLRRAVSIPRRRFDCCK